MGRIEFIENKPERSNSSFQKGGIGTIESIFVGFQESAGFQRFLPPASGEINVCPASNPIFLVPGALESLRPLAVPVRLRFLRNNSFPRLCN